MDISKKLSIAVVLKFMKILELKLLYKKRETEVPLSNIVEMLKTYLVGRSNNLKN